MIEEKFIYTLKIKKNVITILFLGLIMFFFRNFNMYIW